MLKQEASSQEVARPTKGFLCPSKLPRRDLKYSKNWHTIPTPKGAIGSIRLTDIAKSGKSSASGSGAAKCKEPDTPVQKRVRIEGATYRHEPAKSINVGASLHDVPERDEDDDYEEDEEEEDEDGDDDVI